MFSGYNLKLSKDFFDDKPESFDKYMQIGEIHLKTEIDEYRTKLEKYLNNDTINGSKLISDWFSTIDANIFISHSHKDKDLANALAGWIKIEFGLRVFIDSNVWGYSEELLDDINSKYSNKQESGNKIWYDYRSCNYAAQHVNIMLSVALQKMIDDIECVIFLNTDNSVTVFNKDYEQFSGTYSPWIYSEIICTEIIRKKPLLYYREYTHFIHAYESVDYINSFIALKILYNMPLRHLIHIEKKDLCEWENKYKNDIFHEYEKYPLDALYSFTHSKELENTKKISSSCTDNQITRLRECIKEKEVIQKIYAEIENDIYYGTNIENCPICNGERCPYVYNRRILNEQ